MGCADCRTLLCKGCSTEVHSKGVYSRHRVSSYNGTLKNEEKVCEKHGGKVEYFCTEDWQAGCLDCIEAHKKHPVLKIEDAVSDTICELVKKRAVFTADSKRFLLDKQENEKTIENLRAAAELAKEDVERKIGFAKESLNIKRVELLLEIENTATGKISKLNTVVEEINTNISHLNSICSLIELSIKLPGHSLLYNLSYLSSLMENCTAAPHPESSLTLPIELKKSPASSCEHLPRKFTLKHSSSSSIKLA